MRIAYLSPYKGPTLVETRPVIKNLSLSNTVKIELVAKSLRDEGHEVEILSMGEVVERQLRLYPGCYESKRFHPDIPVYYSSALPIRFVNGFWSSVHMLRFLKARHRVAPFDLVIIFNLKQPHVSCANYAIRRLGLPVILQLEDDSFVDVTGKPAKGILNRHHHRTYRQLLSSLSGVIGVSPHLLAEFPAEVPKLLLRGVIGDDIAKAGHQQVGAKQNRILFSGTHAEWNGIRELIESWGIVDLPGWELHITGHGTITEKLRELAKTKRDIVFHGLVSRDKLVELLCTSKICINPHPVSEKPGNIFAFKIVEYLGAGAHCVTTPMGTLEPELEAGITYMPDNAPSTIAATLKTVIDERRYERQAAQAALRTYGADAISNSLNKLLREVMDSKPNKTMGRSLNSVKYQTQRKSGTVPSPEGNKP